MTVVWLQRLVMSRVGSRAPSPTAVDCLEDVMALVDLLCTANTELCDSFWPSRPAAQATEAADQDGTASVFTMRRSASVLEREAPSDFAVRGFAQRIRHVVSSDSSSLRAAYWNTLACLSLRNMCARVTLLPCRALRVLV